MTGTERILNGKFWYLLTKLSQLLELSLLWTLFSIPVLTIGASSAALFDLLGRLDTMGSKTVSTFWESFKAHWKSGSLWWLFTAAVAALGIVDLSICIPNFTTGYFMAVVTGLLVALLLQSVWGTLFYWATDATFVNNGYSFIWFYILYFMAAYFRKYRVTVPSGLCLLAYLAASAAGLFNRMLALRVENALHLNGFVNTVNGYQALATVIASAAMFLLFQNIRIRSDYWRRWVFRLAPLSFGVYLLHDSDFTRALLWRLIDLPRFGGALLPSLAYLTGAVLLIAVAGYAVDAVYQRLYRLLRLPALETKLDALTACILQRIVGSEKA